MCIRIFSVLFVRIFQYFTYNVLFKLISHLSYDRISLSNLYKGVVNIKITIKDVAKDTGLSIGTISKYINNIPIQEKNKLKIEESIKKLNYIPNTTAQHLRSKSSNTICILIPDIGSYIWGKTCNAILACMERYNYSVIIRSYSKSTMYKQDIPFLISKQIDGVILFADYIISDEFISLIQENEIPLVCINQKPGLKADYVSTSHFESAYNATNHLIQQGHKSITVLGIESHSSLECEAGFISACDEKKLNLENQNLIFFKNIKELTKNTSPEDALNKLAKAKKTTALLLLDYHTTMYFVSSHKIMNNYSIISLTDDEILSALNPPITVLEPDYTSLGKNITTLLIQRISGDYKDFPKTILCPSIFHKRESVKNIT